MADNENRQATGIRGPDYALDDTVELTRPDQLQALGNPLRFTILGLLSERAATTSQLAEALGRPRGTIGHHLKVLEAAGLVRVVRTPPGAGPDREVLRARGADVDPRRLRRRERARPGAGSAPGPGRDDRPAGRRRHPDIDIRHARMSAADAQIFMTRLDELADDFELEAEPGAPVYGFVAGLYQTTWPSLPDDALTDDADGEERG